MRKQGKQRDSLESLLLKLSACGLQIPFMSLNSSAKWLLFSVARDSSPTAYAATATLEKIEAKIASPSAIRACLVASFIVLRRFKDI